MDPGDRVVDTEDDDPNPAVVVAVPGGQTLADWTYEVDGEERTTAEANPDYPADEQLVIVAFETVLDEYWPGWEDAATEDLFDGVKEHDINHYGFPESRLGYRTPPTALEAVVARVAPEVDAVEWNPEHQLLVVEKLGETYMVAPAETIQRNGILADLVLHVAEDHLGNLHRYLKDHDSYPAPVQNCDRLRFHTLPWSFLWDDT